MNKNLYIEEEVTANNRSDIENRSNGVIFLDED
jgi:hypothetical protein